METALVTQVMKITGKCSGLPYGDGVMSTRGRRHEVMTLGCPSSSCSYQLLARPSPPSLPSMSSSRSLSSSWKLCKGLHPKSPGSQCPVGTRKVRTCQGSRSSRFAVGRRGIVVVASTSSQTTTPTDIVEQLQGAREAIKELIKSKYCNPILVRLGWHDSGTYDKNMEEWPKCGGANGSIRFKPEIDHAANAGLINALQLIEPIKKQFPSVSYADLFQLASATAIEVAGGPKIPMRYGRVDVNSPEDCALDGNLPAAAPPSPADHLRNVFYRMGLLDKDIVALSGAHTIGRSRPDRSGFGKEVTKYTEDGPGNPGGQSWTPEWLAFDNSYFKEVKAKRDEDLLVLPTDAALFEDPGFKIYADKYAEEEDAFFKDYAEAHMKLSELGSRFDPPEGIVIDGPATTTSTAEAESTSTAAVAAGTAAVSASSGTGSSMSRKDVLLIGLGVTSAGIALKSGLEYAGMDPLRAGNVVQVTLVFGLTVVWTLSYVFRVANKEMTYVKQLKEYEDAVIQKRIEEMPEAELETMLAAIEEEKQRLQR